MRLHNQDDLRVFGMAEMEQGVISGERKGLFVRTYVGADVSDQDKQDLRVADIVNYVDSRVICQLGDTSRDVPQNLRLQLERARAAAHEFIEGISNFPDTVPDDSIQQAVEAFYTDVGFEPITPEVNLPNEWEGGSHALNYPAVSVEEICEQVGYIPGSRHFVDRLTHLGLSDILDVRQMQELYRQYKHRFELSGNPLLNGTREDHILAETLVASMGTSPENISVEVKDAVANQFRDDQFTNKIKAFMHDPRMQLLRECGILSSKKFDVALNIVELTVISGLVYAASTAWMTYAPVFLVQMGMSPNPFAKLLAGYEAFSYTNPLPGLFGVFRSFVAAVVSLSADVARGDRIKPKNMLLPALACADWIGSVALAGSIYSSFKREGRLIEQILVSRVMADMQKSVLGSKIVQFSEKTGGNTQRQKPNSLKLYVPDVVQGGNGYEYADKFINGSSPTMERVQTVEDELVRRAMVSAVYKEAGFIHEGDDIMHDPWISSSRCDTYWAWHTAESDGRSVKIPVSSFVVKHGLNSDKLGEAYDYTLSHMNGSERASDLIPSDKETIVRFIRSTFRHILPAHVSWSIHNARKLLDLNRPVTEEALKDALDALGPWKSDFATARYEGSQVVMVEAPGIDRSLNAYLGLFKLALRDIFASGNFGSLLTTVDRRSAKLVELLIRKLTLIPKEILHSLESMSYMKGNEAETEKTFVMIQRLDPSRFTVTKDAVFNMSEFFLGIKQDTLKQWLRYIPLRQNEKPAALFARLLNDGRIRKFLLQGAGVAGKLAGN